MPMKRLCGEAAALILILLVAIFLRLWLLPGDPPKRTFVLYGSLCGLELGLLFCGIRR